MLLTGFKMLCPSTLQLCDFVSLLAMILWRKSLMAPWTDAALYFTIMYTSVLQASILLLKKMHLNLYNHVASRERNFKLLVCFHVNTQPVYIQASLSSNTIVMEPKKTTHGGTHCSNLVIMMTQVLHRPPVGRKEKMKYENETRL